MAEGARAAGEALRPPFPDARLFVFNHARQRLLRGHSRSPRPACHYPSTLKIPKTKATCNGALEGRAPPEAAKNGDPFKGEQCRPAGDDRPLPRCPRASRPGAASSQPLGRPDVSPRKEEGRQPVQQRCTEAKGQHSLVLSPRIKPQTRTLDHGGQRDASALPFGPSWTCGLFVYVHISCGLYIYHPNNSVYMSMDASFYQSIALFVFICSSLDLPSCLLMHRSVCLWCTNMLVKIHKTQLIINEVLN